MKTCPGWPEADANKLMMTLLNMRHHEAEYRLAPAEVTRQQFLAGYRQFNEIYGSIDGPPEMKANARQAT